MTIDVRVEGLNEVRDLLDRLPTHLYDAAKVQFSNAAFEAQSKITLPMSIGRYGLQSRTGNLARSIRVSVTGTTLSSLKSRVFTESIYAPIHETGGTVTAKRAYLDLEGGPFLNIPADANRTAAGVTRFTAGTVFSQGGYIVPISAPKASYMVALDGLPMFWLVKSVRLEARLRMVSTAEEEVPTLLSNLQTNILEGL